MHNALSYNSQAIREGWAKQWLAKAREYNATVERDSGTISELQSLFAYLIEDQPYQSLETKRAYGYQMLFYCDLTNDWRVWPQWAEELLPTAEPADRVWLLHGLARYYSEYDRYDESSAAHREGIQLCHDERWVDDARLARYWLAAHHTGLSIVLQRQGDFAAAIEHSNLSVSIFRELGETYRLAYALANLASGYERNSEHGLAIARYHQAISLLEEINNRFELGMVHYSLGISYLFDDQFANARQAFERSIELCTLSRNTHQLSNAYYGRAMLHYRLGLYHEAKEDMAASFREFRKANRESPLVDTAAFPVTQGNKYLFAGALYVKSGEIEIALNYLDRAEELYGLSEANLTHLAKVRANRARAFEAAGDISGDYRAAEASFLQLIATGQQLRAPSMIGDAAVHLVRIYRKRQASWPEWLRLGRILGWRGTHGLVVGLGERVKRTVRVRLTK